jgi:hypothetical protein
LIVTAFRSAWYIAPQQARRSQNFKKYSELACVIVGIGNALTPANDIGGLIRRIDLDQDFASSHPDDWVEGCG